MRRVAPLRALSLVACLAISSSCSDDSSPGVSDAAPGDAAQEQGSATEAGLTEAGANDSGEQPADAASETAPSADSGEVDGWSPTNQPGCAGTIYACSDGIDNDGDGRIDAMDPECIGPCDNDEGSYETGIPGDNSDPCKQDCFFDGDSGGGGDKCLWNHKCDPLGPSANLTPACPYDPGFDKCDTTQPTTCLDQCLPVTPNGCDCFGCCEIFSGGTSHIVFLGSGPTCTAATPEGCAPCTQVEECLNECGECELCLGKTIEDLPASCFPSIPDGGVGDGGVLPDMGPPMPECPPSLTPCITNNDCPASYYCLTGCCTPGID